MSVLYSRQVSLLIGACLVVLAFTLMAQGKYGGEFAEAEDLLGLSIEEFMNIQVTSVSKKTEKASHAAAAVFVITHEDIKRSGATRPVFLKHYGWRRASMLRV